MPFLVSAQPKVTYSSGTSYHSTFRCLSVYGKNSKINRRFQFARFARTTFVIGAESHEAAEGNLNALHTEAEGHGWKIFVPHPSQ